ncbi:hypothetical protein POTOM_034987 [Populus tomentosa]|uniref:Subtilisin-like protease fibronectin type-III domain-containing protein n=1 Tax=Populus tomentosa TaxID=118781 RepID=A0A8X8CPM1_POPTO|nr:hypothetical protein POTOM_034987 [Populus tomentosa]
METSYGLIAASDAAVPGVTAKNASFSKDNTPDPAKIKGKIVLCITEVLIDDPRKKAVAVQLGGGQPTYCPKQTKPSYDFNYPSIGVSNMNGSISVYRTVTYYGIGQTVSVAKVNYPSGVQVTVTPATLKFTKTGEKLSFKIDFKPLKTSDGNFVFGALTWSNGIHKVRSPIALNVLSL